MTRFFTNEQTSKIVTHRGKHNALYPAFDLCYLRYLCDISSRGLRRFSQIDPAFDLCYLCDISSRGSRRFSQIDPAFDLRYLCDISSRGSRGFTQIDPAFDLCYLCYLREFGFIPTQRRKALRGAP